MALPPYMVSKGKLVLIVRPEQSDSQNPHEKPIKDQFTLPGKWGTSPEPGLGRELKGERLVAGPKAIGPSGYAQQGLMWTHHERPAVLWVLL